MFSYTYPELALLSESITDSQGHTFKPLDLRKGYAYFWSDKDEQQQPVSLWLAWQKSVQIASKKANVVPQRVMDYFQKTKGLSKPPANEVVIETTAVQSAKPTKPLFATSYSGMQLFEQCPYRWSQEKWYKTVPYEEGEAAKWGNRVHLAFENTLNKRPTPEDTKILTDHGWMKYANAFLAAEAKAETEICLTEDLKPCGWRDWNKVWFRLKADILVKKERVLKYFDIKSGKRKEDPFQIETTWAVASQHYPEVEEFDGKLLFLKEKENAVWGPGVLTREDLPRIWAKIYAITDRMKEAVKHENFRMQANGLCRQYCGATMCPHCGRGK